MADRIDQRTYELFGPDFSAYVQRTLRLLRREFPDAFDTVKPLALGIRAAIVEQSRLTDAQVAQFLTFYTRSAAYLQAQMQPGAVRVDLDGNTAGEVSLDNRHYAIEHFHLVRERRRDHDRWLAFRARLTQSEDTPWDAA